MTHRVGAVEGGWVVHASARKAPGQSSCQTGVCNGLEEHRKVLWNTQKEIPPVRVCGTLFRFGHTYLCLSSSLPSKHTCCIDGPGPPRSLSNSGVRNHG